MAKYSFSWLAVSWWAVVPAVVACSQGAETPVDPVSPGQTTPTGSTPVTPSPSGDGTSPTGQSPTGSDVNPGPTGSPVAPASSGVSPGVAPQSTSTGSSGTTGPTSTVPIMTQDLTPVETVECQGGLPNQDISGATHVLSTNYGYSRGALPHFWTTYGLGRMGLYLPREALSPTHSGQDSESFDGRLWSDVLEEHTIDAVDNLELRSIRAHGLFHDDIGIYTEDASGNPVYDFTRSDIIFDFLVVNGIKPIVELASMPAALAADPSKTVFDWNMIVSPPKDYAKWQGLVQAFVQHSVDRYGEEEANSWYYEVWNEPECCNGKFWGGSGTRATPEEYFQLYDAAAAGVRAVLPTGRMGGPVTSQPSELIGGQWMGGAGVLFLDHLDQTGGPLDLFTFHTWSFLEGAIAGYFTGLDLLDSRGRTQTPIAVTEFGPTWEFGLRGVTSGENTEPDWEPQETSQGAAFVAQVYADISRRCALEGRRFPIAYSWWTLSDIFDEGYEDPEDYVLEDTPFIGAMGLMSRESIKKPAYNAYKFLAQMGDEQLDLSAQSPGGVNGLAARDAEGGVQVLIYNGQNPGGGFRDDTYYAVTEAQSISLTIDGLKPETAYDVTAYRVDETHGNSFAKWDEQGRPAMSQMDDAAWQALRDAAESPAEPLGQAVCGTTTNLKFDLPSPGVLFVSLTPAKP